jgi:hypothetical protein
MNIYTVRDNLKNTIAGKEKMLASERENYKSEDPHIRMVAYATIKFVEISIDELKRILKDVEVCCQQHTEMGWQINPERMGQ